MNSNAIVNISTINTINLSDLFNKTSDTLFDISNVFLNVPANQNDILSYDSSNSRFHNIPRDYLNETEINALSTLTNYETQTVAEGKYLQSTDIANLNNIGDVTITNIQNDQILI